MSNPIYQQMQSVPVGGTGNNILQQFMQFRQNFSGDPKAQVQQLLNSGKVTQQQYDQAVNMANQFQKMLNGR